MNKHRSADAHYYKHWGDGLLTGRGGFGSLLFLADEVCFRRGLHVSVVYSERYNYVILKN